MYTVNNKPLCKYTDTMATTSYNTFPDIGRYPTDPKMNSQTHISATDHNASNSNVIGSSGKSANDKNIIGGATCDDDADDEDLRCGLGSCKSDGLQVFNNPKAILAWLCWFAFIQGFMVNGVNNVNTSTMERRFQLTSSKAGVISSSYDISAALFAIPISYYGAHAHQPRMLAIAALIMSCGAFIMIIPHFATGLYDLRDIQADQCINGTNVTSECDYNRSSLTMWLGVFVVGMILIGVGGTTLYSIGIVYLDSSVNTRSSPLYQGIFACSATLGPAVGYLLGGYFLESFYVDIDQVAMSSIAVTPSDPRFVGAWWMGFLISGCLLITVVLLVMCYPRELPAAKAARLKCVVQVHQSCGNEVASREGFGKKWKDMPAALKVLFRNPVYICNNLAAVCDGMILSGFATFMTKILQNQFSLTAGRAATYAGLASVPGAAGGQITGALICKFARLNVRGMIRMNIGLSLAAASSCAIFFMRCSTAQFAGLNADYLNTDTTLSEVNLESTCNADCGCTSLSYEPICGNNGVQYFSPCHAGCQTIYHSNNTKSFVSCSCISQSAASSSISMATSGVCDVDCTYIVGFLVMFFVTILLVFLASVPTLTITLRCIPESQRSFGIGVQWVFVRLLGTIPGPIMMGTVFDSTCMVWQERCDGRGSCWLYDSAQLSIRVFIMALVVKIVSAIFFSMALCFYKPPPGQNDTECNTEETTDGTIEATSDDKDASH